MSSLYALAAPLALVLPLLGQQSPVPIGLDSSAKMGETATIEGESCQSSTQNVSISEQQAAPVSDPLGAMRADNIRHQFRVQRRVVVRISPQRRNKQDNLLNNLPQNALNSRYVEKKMEKCVPVSRIAGVQTGSGNRLILFLKDKRIVTVNLENSCRAREFYSGFYVERNKDGKLCVDRDKLQSRTGASCEVARMRQLVAIKK